MPVKFPEFDIEELAEDENIDPHIAKDLEIIDNGVEKHLVIEKESPFISKPKKKVYKPLPPNQEVELEKRVIEENKVIEKEQKKERKKKQLSEKQKKHLENMRMKKAKKKMESVKEKITSTSNEYNFPQYKEPTEEELADMEKSEFDLWLKNMSKFEKIMAKMETEKQKKAEAERKKEEALEMKYRKKFEAEQLAKKQVEKKIRPLKKGSIAQPDLPINFNPLQQQETNPYDKYFTF